MTLPGVLIAAANSLGHCSHKSLQLKVYEPRLVNKVTVICRPPTTPEWKVGWKNIYNLVYWFKFRCQLDLMGLAFRIDVVTLAERIHCPYPFNSARELLVGNLLGGGFEEFCALNNIERMGFVFGCENWERYKFKGLLRILC